MIKLVPTLSFAVSVVGVIVIFGWFLDNDLLKRIVPGFVTMKFTTALSFLLSGAILYFAHLRESNRNLLPDLFLPVVILVMALFMGSSLVSVLFGFSNGTEKLFVEERVDAILTVVPGQPSIGTMVAFLFIVILGVIALGGWSATRRTYIYLGPSIMLIAGLALLGYVLGIPELYYVIDNFSSGMAIHTACLFVFVGFGFSVLGHKMKRV